MSSFSATPTTFAAGAAGIPGTQDMPSAPSRLDELLGQSTERLGDLYRGAATPRLTAVRGDLRGRMLTTAVLPAPVEALARLWAGSNAFVWRGKSFMPQSLEQGEGINRVVSDRVRLFRFQTFIGRSRAGDFDALQLDYDLPGNPWLIRQIKDEIRELAPNLYLGQAYLRLRGREHLVLYFGLEGKAG